MSSELLSELIKKANENEKDSANQEKLAELIVLECVKLLEEKALSIYDPNNQDHKSKESWDRSLSWAIRDVSGAIKEKFNIED